MVLTTQLDVLIDCFFFISKFGDSTLCNRSSYVMLPHVVEMWHWNKVRNKSGKWKYSYRLILSHIVFKIFERAASLYKQPFRDFMTAPDLREVKNNNDIYSNNTRKFLWLCCVYAFSAHVFLSFAVRRAAFLSEEISALRMFLSMISKCVPHTKYSLKMHFSLILTQIPVIYKLQEIRIRKYSVCDNGIYSHLRAATASNFYWHTFNIFYVLRKLCESIVCYANEEQTIKWWPA